MANKRMIRASVLMELTKGSLEDRMTAVDRAIEEKFGSDAVLIATFDDKAILLTENGEFISTKYVLGKNGALLLSQQETLSVPISEESDMAGDALSTFYKDGSLVEGLREVVMASMYSNKTPFERTKEAIGVLFSGGSLWRKQVSENKEKYTKMVFDGSMGSSQIDSKPVFEKLYNGEVSEEELPEHRKEVLTALAQIEGRLSRLNIQTEEAFEKCQQKMSGHRDGDADQILSRFEGFARDYLDHLSEVGGFVSESIRNGKTGCVACAAMVHDEVAKRAIDLELGGRLIQRLATEFA
jgi:hypothetical protein